MLTRVSVFSAITLCLLGRDTRLVADGLVPLSTLAISRREALWHQGPAIASLAAVITSTATPPLAVAAVESTDVSPMETVNVLLGRLHEIPTFCIVSPAGAAYMVFKQDQSMAVGYAFSTFQGALAVLGDAQWNAAEKGYTAVWDGATITTIPLDIAVRLALKKRQRTSQKDQVLDTLLMVIPGAVSCMGECMRL
jgi:hypothetical protein